MINIRPIIRRVKRKGELDIDNMSQFFDGVLIYHTKKNPNRKFQLGLTIDGIANRKRHCKHRWPIRWWLQEELPQKLRRRLTSNVRWWCKRVYWNIRHKFDPKHQYHVIKPRTLTPGYYTEDERMMHSMFEMLLQYYENGFNRVGWDDESWNNMDHRGMKPSDVRLTIEELHHWWTVTRPNRVEVPYPKELDRKTDDGYDDLFFPLSAKYKREHPEEYKVFQDWCNQSTKQEEDWEKEDDEMILKLVSVRHYLWT